MQRNKKFISLIYLACGVVTWLIFREIVVTIWVLTRLSQPTNWIVPPPDAIAAVAGLVVFVILIRNVRVNIFVNEVITELAEVAWPKPKETVLSTGIVSVLVGICAAILFGFDMFWGLMIRIFYR